MGLLPCPLPCTSNEESDSKSQSNHLNSESSNSSLYSQPSLPSVPSLTPPNSQQPPTAHHACLATLKGRSHVFALTLDGKHLYSGYSDSETRVWSGDPSEPLQNPADNLVAEGHSAVKSLIKLGNKLFTAHQDHKIRVWKMDSDAPHQKYKCMATLPTLDDRVARFFSAKNYVQVRRHKKSTWVHHVDAVSALATSKDASLLYSVSWDRTLKVWRTSDFKCLESVWNAHDDAINALVVSGDGYVYTGSADRRIKVWKKQEGDKKHTLVDTLEKHRSAVNALALSTDGGVLYSGACDRSIIVWEKEDGGGGGGGHMVVAGALRGHTKPILCLAVVSDLVCSGSADKTVRIWRRGLVGKAYFCLAVLEGHAGPVKCLTAAVHASTSNASATSFLVCSGGLDCDIKLWQTWVPLL